MVLEKGLEPLRLAAPDPKSGVSAIPPFKHLYNIFIKCLGAKASFYEGIKQRVRGVRF